MLYISASWCAVLLGETKQLGLAVSQTTEFALMCIKIKMRLLSMGGAACLRLGYSMQLSTAVLFSSIPFSSDDTHFYSLPFRLKFLWLELIVLATANCPSTWFNCDRKEEAENEI